MKIKWSVEGAGCQFAQCGLRDFEIEIPDNEIEGFEGVERDKFIDEWVQDESCLSGCHPRIVTPLYR